jgi:hypothetical protein
MKRVIKTLSRIMCIARTDVWATALATVTVLVAAFALPGSASAAGQFPVLEAGFTQELYATAPTSTEFGGVAFAPNADVWVAEPCSFIGAPLDRFNNSTTTLVNGSNVHPLVAGSPFASNAGCGLTNNPDGFLYSNTSSGVVQIDASTGAPTGVVFGAAGDALGITTDPQTGNLVYVASDGTILTAPPGGSSSTFSTVTTGSFIDGVSFDPTGNFLFVSNRTLNVVTIIARSGALVQNSAPIPGVPDGISVHATSPKFVVTNNNDGSMTRLDFPADDYTMPPVNSVFASGGFRGDLTQVGSDGCVYLTQGGTRYDNGTTSTDNSIVRICGGFAPPPGVEPESTTTSTSLSGGGQSGETITVPEGTAVTDNATLSGKQAAKATGKVSYKVYSDNTCTKLVTEAGEVEVTGGVVPASNPETLAQGTYYWTASYSGDNSNKPSSSKCGAETVTVTDLPITASGTTVSATEGANFSGSVASFTDPDTAAMASEYEATIEWGDGSKSTGTISGPTGGPFSVSGEHTYAEEGSYTITVTITDVDNSSNIATATSTANVVDAALSSKCAAPLTSTQAFAGSTATFTDADPNGMSPPDYSATINWGDSSSSSGTVSLGTGPGPYTVSGSHAYKSTGPFTITTTITDAGGSQTVATCKTIVFAFAPGGGSFVIGDKNAATGTSVTFWGAQWWKLNSLSGGSGPSSLKGFAENPATPICEAGWSTDPGNSTPPPAGPLPEYMGVIVSSKITKSGSQISGDTPHIVVVKTDPGYQPNPGHAGTGTVVAQVC